MRPAIPLLLGTLLVLATNAQAQSAATPTAVPQPAATPAHAPKAAHATQQPHKLRPARVAKAAAANAPASAAGGVALGASDITGNKELPKVMVIVPWKDSLGAGGVIKPTDSLLDGVLQPVDRGVFQRQIRYYGQIDAPAATTSRVAPVGDSH